MRKMALTAFALLLAIPMVASAQPVSNYSVGASFTGGEITVGWGETVAPSVSVSLACPDDPFATEMYVSQSITWTSFSNTRHQSVNGTIQAVGNHIACDGTVTNGVAYSVEFSGTATGHTDRTRTTTGNRVLTTPMAFSFTASVLPASQGGGGNFVEVIS